MGRSCIAADDRQCWLADWPGMGRSGGADILDVDIDTVVGGFVQAASGCHRRPVRDRLPLDGGPVRVAAGGAGVGSSSSEIVALSPSDPGKHRPRPPRSWTRTAKRSPCAILNPASTSPLRTDRQFVVSDENVTSQWIATSTRFPLAHLEEFTHALVPTPPKLVLQRLGAEGGMPRYAAPTAYDGLWVRIVVPTDDPARTRDNTQPLVDLLRSWGADAESIYLADRGIAGNGHFMFCEQNSDELLELLLGEIG